MNYQVQLYIVYFIVGTTFFLFTKPFWEFLFSLFQKKEKVELKKNIYEHNCGKCKIKN